MVGQFVEENRITSLCDGTDLVGACDCVCDNQLRQRSCGSEISKRTLHRASDHDSHRCRVKELQVKKKFNWKNAI